MRFPSSGTTPQSAELSTEKLREQFRQGLDHPNPIDGHRKGDVDAALSSAAKRIEREYDVPYLAHATMEPQTCTAHVTAERAEVWAPTQNGEGTLAVVAAALGIDREKVVVHKRQLGGGFGRRGLAQDWARQAVLIAKAVRPAGQDDLDPRGGLSAGLLSADVRRPPHRGVRSERDR